MATKRGNEFVQITTDGGLFDAGLDRRLQTAISEGLDEIADDGDDIMAGYIAAGGFVDTGQLLSSVDAKHVRSGGAPGYVKIAPTAVWPEPNRPTRTWIAKGTRGGVRLRPGYDIFSRTATALNRQGAADKVLRRLVAVLE